MHVIQNVVKHSGAKSAKVELIADGNELVLVVSDSGSGFDPFGPRVNESLGLTSMQERVLANNGTVTITSSKESGTRIEARIPFAISPAKVRTLMQI